MRILTALAGLVKVRIAALATITAAGGFVAAARGFSPGLLGVGLGVFLLACGACALNQFQERALDAKMPRTAARPLPSGRIRPSTALAAAFALIVAGFWCLFLGFGPAPALLGLSAVVWYNGVYTPMKRWTAFAAVPGALVGAVPPVLGWTAGGGPLLSPQSLALGFFFFLWQVPHFWVLLCLCGPEYQGAGYPSLTGLLGPKSLGRLAFVWLLAAAAASMFLVLARVAGAKAVHLLLLGCAAWVCLAAAPPLLRGDGEASLRSAFRRINLYALLVVVLLAADPYVLRAFSF